MLEQHRFDLRDERVVVPEGKLGIGPVFDGGQPQGVQPRTFGVDGGEVAQVLERGAAPQAQGRVQRAGRALGVAADQRPAPGPGQVLEGLGVKLACCHLQQVAERAGLEPHRFGAERAAQAVDVALQSVASGGRWFAIPEVLGEAIVGHRVAGVQQQQSQQPPLMWRPEVERLPLVVDLQRAQHPELHDRPPASA